MDREKGTTRIEVQHLGEQRYVGENSGCDKIVIDGSAGPSIGMRPMESLLVALGTCTAFDVAEILQKRRTPPEGYRIELEGARADEAPRRYTHIHVRHIVSGAGIDQKNLERAVQLSHDKYCSVSATLNAEISTESVLEE